MPQHPGEAVRRPRWVLVFYAAWSLPLLIYATLAVFNEARSGRDWTAGAGSVLVVIGVITVLNTVILGRRRAWVDRYGVLVFGGPRWMGAWHRVPWSAVLGVEPKFFGVRIYTPQGFELVSLGKTPLGAEAMAEQIRRWWLMHGSPPPPPPR